MHEIGMLYQTAKLVTEYADKKQIDEVKNISLEIGELAGVLPEIFTDYFAYVAEQFPKLKNAKLQIKMVPSEALCTQCQCLYNILRNEGICPRCHSTMKTVLGGTDVQLQNIGY